MNYQWYPGHMMKAKRMMQEDIRLIDLDGLVRHHVVGQMRIDRRSHGAATGLDVGQEREQRGKIVAFGKAFLLHQAFTFQNLVRIEKAVRGDEIDLGA